METDNQPNEEKQRSEKQNRSLHKFCTEVASACNEIGITQKNIIDHTNLMGVDNTMSSIKRLFQMIGEAKFGKSETHKFTTKEMTDVEKEVSKIIVEVSKGEVNPVWPSEEERAYKVGRGYL